MKWNDRLKTHCKTCQQINFTNSRMKRLPQLRHSWYVHCCNSHFWQDGIAALYYKILQAFSDPVFAANMHLRSDLVRVQYLHFAIKENLTSDMHGVCVFAAQVTQDLSLPANSQSYSSQKICQHAQNIKGLQSSTSKLVQFSGLRWAAEDIAKLQKTLLSYKDIAKLQKTWLSWKGHGRCRNCSLTQMHSAAFVPDLIRNISLSLHSTNVPTDMQRRMGTEWLVHCILPTADQSMVHEEWHGFL